MLPAHAVLPIALRGYTIRSIANIPRRKAPGWLLAVCAAALPLAARSERMDALDPMSDAAESIADLGWAMFAGALVITLLVLLLLIAGLLRGRRREPRPLSPATSRRLVLAGGVFMPLVVLFVLVTASVWVGRTVVTAAAPDALTIEVIGRRWWWEIHYLDQNNFRIATTANEIHVPTGRPVRLLLRSDNVIHSFWAPRLQGKIDLIPGQINTLHFEAREPGVYQGQCAEFCGIQHAKMRFLVVAQPEAEFEQWLRHQAQPAPRVTARMLVQGRQVFRAACARCHTIRGVGAGAAAGPGQRTIDGPDLTHVGSRKTLAAAIIPNTPGHMGGWIADPQSIKPGSLMPPVPLEPEDLRAVVHYLQYLK